MNGFQRHIDACNTPAALFGLVPFRIGGAEVGWLSPDLARALTADAGDLRLDGGGAVLAPRLRDAAARSAALARIALAVVERGLCRIRDEAFDIRATPEGPVLAQLDRGAIPAFGVIAQGVHVNGLVRRADGLHLWVGVRAAHKAVAPGKLDHIVAGGIPAGLTPFQCMVKEAGEEASIPPALAARARPSGTRLSYMMRLEEGLRRDVLHVFDLDLPEDFVPRPNDHEVARFELWPAARVLAAVRDTDEVKFNVNLVLVDLFLREGLIDPASAEGRALRAGLDQGPA